MAEEKTLTLAERRAEAEEKLRAAQEAHSHVVEERELAILELRAKYVDKGVEGEDWMVIDCGDVGPVAIVLPEKGRMVMLKQFRAPIDDPKNGKITLENSMQFVTPCIGFPDRATFLAACQDRPGIVYSLSNELHRMLGRNGAEEKGK